MIEIFCCVADADQPFLEKLSTRLTVQQKRGTIKLWDKSQIEVGRNVNREIQRHLASSRIFLLLISPDFLDNDYCYNKVMRPALEKHTRGEAITIPVIVRHATWQDVDILAPIQVLPRDGKPISSRSNEDEALWEVAKEIGVVIGGLEEDDKPTPVDLPSQVRKEPTLTHFLKLIVTRSGGWIVIGILISLTGMFWGLSSPTAAYLKSQDVSDHYAYTKQDSDIYIYPMNNRTTLFIVRCNDLSPHIDCTQISGIIYPDFLARPDTISVNATLPSDTPGRNLHVTQAHVIEQLVLFDANGNSRITYQASDYNSSGYYQSRWWPAAFALIGAGLLIMASVALFARLKRHKGA
jgi:hypothetical protein